MEIVFFELCWLKRMLHVAYVKSCRKTLDILGSSGRKGCVEGMRPWVDAAIRTSVLRNPFPAPCGYIAWPGFMFAQAVPGGSGSSSAADVCEGYERGHGDNCLVHAAASWHPR